MTKRLVMIALLAGMALPAHAAEIRVVSGGAVEPGLRAAVKAFEQKGTDTVSFRFATGPEIRKLIEAGGDTDIVIAPGEVTADMMKAGKLAGETVPVGRVGIGVAVRKGAPVPDVSTLASLTKAINAADEIDYNVATTGLVLKARFEKLGLLDKVEAKAQHFANGEKVVEHLAAQKSGYQIGFGAITEIKLFAGKGVTFVGPVPPELQKYSTYVAAAMPGKDGAAPVQRFMAYLKSPGAKAIFVKAGVEQ